MTLVVVMLLQIAPMSMPRENDPTVREKYIFAGYYATPEGGRDPFNKQGAQDPRPLPIPNSSSIFLRTYGKDGI